MAEDSKATSSFGKLRSVFRECLAIVFWTYLLIKLFVFDVDIYIVDHLVPQFRWILNIRAFIILALLAGMLIILGRKKFLGNVLYILGYPLVVLFWKLPVLAFRKWPLAIAFAPVIYRAISTSPTTFLLYTLAALSALAITASRDSAWLVAGMLGFFVFLLAHLYRSFREAYSEGVTSRLSMILRKFKEQIQNGMFDSATTPEARKAESTQNTHMDRAPRNPTSLYLLRSVTDILIDKIRWVARSRKYDVYLVLSWLYTFAVTATVFAFEYFALGRIDPESFGSVASASTFFGFFGYSLGNLLPTRISRIAPMSEFAILLTYTEEFCALLVFVILVFTILTAARESHKADLEQFSVELTGLAEAVDIRIAAVYSMSLYEVEIFLMRDSSDLVNSMRKARGLPELAAPIEVPPKHDG